MPGLIWIQTVWHSGDIPERNFRKTLFWKKAADDKIKHAKLKKEWEEKATFCSYYLYFHFRCSEEQIRKVCQNFHPYMSAGFFLQFWEGVHGLLDWVKKRGKPLIWEICYSAQLCHFWSIKKQISYYTYWSLNWRRTSPCSVCVESTCSVCVDWMKIPIFKQKKKFFEDWDFFFKIGKKSPWEWGWILAPENTK